MSILDLRFVNLSKIQIMYNRNSTIKLNWLVTNLEAYKGLCHIERRW